MRRAVASLLLTLAIVTSLAQSVASAGPAPRYSRLYVFGDSYSDIGAGYIDGDGPTAVAYLAWLMGLPVAPSTAANATGKSLVFAHDGHPSTAVHRIVGKKLFEEIVTRPPGAP
jgi:phospholipase/lecithinase/hemolysin